MKISLPIFLVSVFCFTACSGPSDSSVSDEAETEESIITPDIQSRPNLIDANNLTFSLVQEQIDYKIPALHSFADATYNGLWIIIGGQTVGFHGTSNNPPPFLNSFANDSLWVIDPVEGATYGAPIPHQYWNALSASNSLSYQLQDKLYMCGGYTVSDSMQTRFNTTSNYLFEIDLPSLVAYVKSGGVNPSTEEVFPIVLQDNFVQVTGGEMIIVDDYFYLVGGQNYQGAYASGRTGDYTNAIRSFTLEQEGSIWLLSNKDSIVDPENLHRRDFNLVPFVAEDESLNAILLGGVFTPQDLSYNNPVFINGLSQGKATISVGDVEQKCNQYTCAVVPMYYGTGQAMQYALLGGISYMMYNLDSAELVIGDQIENHNIPMPFSNLVTLLQTDGVSLSETVQIPPDALLPEFMGSNAAFFVHPQFATPGLENVLNMNAVLASPESEITVGYMYGGIVSEGPTSGTTPSGHVSTYANPVLYAVQVRVVE